MSSKAGQDGLGFGERVRRGGAVGGLSWRASITIRARGRSSSTAARRSDSVRVRCSISSPPPSQDTHLAFLLVDVDAKMVHGRLVLSAALAASVPCGAAYATTSSGRPAASSYLCASRESLYIANAVATKRNFVLIGVSAGRISVVYSRLDQKLVLGVRPAEGGGQEA